MFDINRGRPGPAGRSASRSRLRAALAEDSVTAASRAHRGSPHGVARDRTLVHPPLLQGEPFIAVVGPLVRTHRLVGLGVRERRLAHLSVRFRHRHHPPAERRGKAVQDDGLARAVDPSRATAVIG